MNDPTEYTAQDAIADRVNDAIGGLVGDLWPHIAALVIARRTLFRSVKKGVQWEASLTEADLADNIIGALMESADLSIDGLDRYEELNFEMAEFDALNTKRRAAFGMTKYEKREAQA